MTLSALTCCIFCWKRREKEVEVVQRTENGEAERYNKIRKRK